MHWKLGLAILAITLMAGMTGATAIAGDREVVHGVTVLRGTSEAEQNAANAANAPTTVSPAPEIAGTYSVDVNGRLKQMSIGSSVPPGWVVVPSPEAGR